MMPEISIGLPVYNGERFLAEALDSILAQSFGDFEVVICDNASTDRTAEICNDFAARDSRIRYHRQPENIGAAGNYNDSFRRSRGRYFKWAAHDDIVAAGFLDACLTRLETDPCLAVVFARMREINEDGQVLGDYDAEIEWLGRSPASRLESLLCSPPAHTYIRRCLPITGLMRVEFLRQTRLIGRFGHADKVTLVELALLGDFAEIPEPLFFRRRHAAASLAANPTPVKLVRWFDPKNRSRIVTPRNRLFREYIHAVARAPIGSRERAACFGVLARLLRRDWRILGGEMRRALQAAILNSEEEIRY